MDQIQVDGLEFDDANRGHVRHGVTESVVVEVYLGSPRYFLNPPREGRSGSHLMVGPDAGERLWTIVIVVVDDAAAIWRPITGWPSTAKEERQWHDAN